VPPETQPSTQTAIVRAATRRIADARDLQLVCHVSPDGDALGSLLGLGKALERLQKRVSLVCPDPFPEEARHLPGWEQVKLPQDAAGQDYDLLISLDCSAPDRLGAVYELARSAGIPILNIDHHPTNTAFGAINWVEPKAAATAQIIVKLVHALDIPIDVEIATCLLHGILADTRGFRTSNTGPDVLRTAVELVDCGAPLSFLCDRIFNRRPLKTIHLWAQALQNLSLEGRILSSEITQEMRQRIGYLDEGDSGLVNYLNTANEADIAVVFEELQDGQVDVSLRAVPGFDVSGVALHLGGGGHALASGCTLPGPLTAARTRVLPLLQQAWETQAPAQ
jgi:phosphoesterase RecJ-like protein